jgi:histidinol-phosphate aminotransferase
MKFEPDNLVRHNIRLLKPYSSARHEFKGEASVFLDANENSYGSPVDNRYNRYPDPLQGQLKSELSKITGVATCKIGIGNGSDEVIDLAYRIFCNPGSDNVIICPPTYGMYAVNAGINDVETRSVNLTKDFQLDLPGIVQATDSHTKLLFICSPNNPTGNNMKRSDVKWLLSNFSGIVIIDEAYINYSKQRSFIDDLDEYPNLVVMQTLSKAWGLAALRVGICYASTYIIDLFNKVKPPYNINEASQQTALAALQNIDQVNTWVEEIEEQKTSLVYEIKKFAFVKKVYPSDANFILVKVEAASRLYQYLASCGIIVRNRSNEINCQNCLRISIGTPEENELLIKALKKYEKN